MPPQWVLVQVAETRHQRDALLREIMAHVLLPQLLLVVVALLLVAFGVRHGLRPLATLRDALAQRSHRALEPLALQAVPSDLRPLVEEMNALMARLGQTLDVQNRFIADAAHQLKTPVSGLKAQIELALREEDPQRLHHSLAQILIGVERLSRLVRQLLALARNEPDAAASMALSPTDLTDLALQVSMEWVPQALRRQIDLGFDGPGRPVMIHADADRLRELLNNLVDNAVRYSRESGRVTVALAVAASGEACLSVHDDGPHIPPAERERVFQRFHRVLGTEADGSGLGLAIVSEIARAHGARITVDEDDDGIGNTFRVWFPPRSPGAPSVL
jgi:two-component system sensor histidine kinase TctE